MAEKTEFMDVLEQAITAFCAAVTRAELEIIAWSPTGFVNWYNEAKSRQLNVSLGLDAAEKYPPEDRDALLRLEQRNLASLQKLSSLKDSATKLLGITWEEQK